MLEGCKSMLPSNGTIFFPWLRTRENLSKWTQSFCLCLYPCAYSHNTAVLQSLGINLLLTCYCFCFPNHLKCDRSRDKWNHRKTPITQFCLILLEKHQWNRRFMWREVSVKSTGTHWLNQLKYLTITLMNEIKTDYMFCSVCLISLIVVLL